MSDAPSTSMRFRALLIGNGEYPCDPSGLPRLVGPGRDVQQLSTTLTRTELGLFMPASVASLCDERREDVVRAMESMFRDASPWQHLLLYYSGHGRIDIHNHLYLCTKDSHSDTLHATAIAADVIARLTRRTRAKSVVVLLDCCHSGAFAFKGGDPALDFGGTGRFALTSTNRFGLSEDGAEGSTFTRLLARGLLSGGADADSDGIITVGEAFDFVRRELSTHGAQRPMLHAYGAARDAPLARAWPHRCMNAWAWIEAQGKVYLSYVYTDPSAGPSAKGGVVTDRSDTEQVLNASTRPGVTFRAPTGRLHLQPLAAEEVAALALPAEPEWITFYR